MNAESELPDDDASITEELTAYLDGELSPDDVPTVEMRLGSDPEYLAKMQELQNTWDLLDQVTEGEPRASFTKTTMEMVVQDAATQSKSSHARSWTWPLRIGVMLTIPVMLFAVSFGVVRNFQTQPDRLLIQDLSVIDNHYRYAEVKFDIDFLDRLNRHGLFSDGLVYGQDIAAFDTMLDSVEVDLIPESAPARRELVESLDLEQKNKLKKKLDDYLKLSEPERESLRNFDRELVNHENRTELTAVLVAYYDWLKTIEPGERVRLLDLEASDRVREIAKLRNSRARQEFGKTGRAKLPSDIDAQVIFRWYEASFWAKENMIRDHFPVAITKYARENSIRRPPGNLVRRVAKKGNLPRVVAYLMEVDRPFIEQQILQEPDLNMLYFQLTRDAQRILDECSDEERQALVWNWIESANQAKFDVSINTLRKFSATLTRQEKDELNRLSPQFRLEALRKKYRERNKSKRNDAFDELDTWPAEFAFPL